MSVVNVLSIDFAYYHTFSPNLYGLIAYTQRVPRILEESSLMWAKQENN